MRTASSTGYANNGAPRELDSPYLPGLGRGDLTGTAFGIVDTIVPAIATALVNMAHVVGLLLVESIRYRARFAKLFPTHPTSRPAVRATAARAGRTAAGRASAPHPLRAGPSAPHPLRAGPSALLRPRPSAPVRIAGGCPGRLMGVLAGCDPHEAPRT